MAEIAPKIEKSWKLVLQEEFNKDYFHELKGFLLHEKRKYTIYPPGPSIFNAFQYTPFQAVNVVILGQDPYPGKGQAHGLCFSVPDGVELPRSLVNIYKELSDDLGISPAPSGNLTSWATQGVLLLNSVLTVRAGQPGSHRNRGWEQFTDEVIRKISDLKNGVVFILWGNYAKEKTSIIDTEKHFILTAAHPSPFSANNGFFGCRHFSKTNVLLKQQGKNEVAWQV